MKKNCLSVQQSWFSVTRNFCCFLAWLKHFAFFPDKNFKRSYNLFYVFFSISDSLLHHLTSPLHLRSVLKTNIWPGRKRCFKMLNIWSQRQFLPESLMFEYGKSVEQEKLNFTLLVTYRTNFVLTCMNSSFTFYDLSSGNLLSHFSRCRVIF